VETSGADKLDKILNLLETPQHKAKLPVEENGRITLLDPDEIVLASISGRNVVVKTRNHSYETGYTLAELEDRLGLLRTHKSYLVNREMVREIIPWFNATYNLVMNDQDKSEVPVSRTFLKPVRQALNL